MSGFSIKRPSIKITDIKRLCRKAKEKNDLRSKVALWRGDITRLEIDAIVNAANRTLLGGGGVDGAIHAAAGRKLLQECETLNGCETGEAKITKGYKLPAKHVIHTVGPIGEDEEMLKSCYENSLNIVLEKKLKSVAFPCISTGIYGYPNKEAAHVALGTVKEWLMKNHKNVDLIIFCLFLEIDVRIYNKLADEYFPQSGDDSNSSSVKDSSTSAEEAMSVDSDDNTSPVKMTEGDAVESKSVQLPEEVSMKDDNISTDNPELSQKSDDGISNDKRTGEAEKQSHEESKSMTDDDATEPESMQTQEEVSMQSNEETDLKSVSVEAPSSTTEQCSIHDEVESKIELEGDGGANSKHPEETSEKSCDEQDSDSDKEIQDKPGLSEKEREEWIEKFGRSTSEAICKVIKEDTEKWAFDDLSSLKLIGGLDVSYHKTRSDVSCVSLVVLSYPDLNVVYEDSTIESVTVPYISGYLAYREAEFYQEKIEAVKKTNYSPQVILVDGNGTLHPRKFGSATHVGVHSNIPTIGVAKNLIVIEEFGIHRDEHHRTQVAGLEKRGSGFDVVTSTEEVLGKAVRTSQEGWKPVYVSIGHRISLDTAVRVTLACCKHRVPEPIRQADQISKSKLRKEFKNDYDSYYAKKQ